SFDADGLTVERLSLGEFGGASLNVSGRISTGTAAPRGSLGIDLDARDLTGLSALLAKFAPAALDPVRRMIDRMGATKLRATLDVVDASEKGRSTARFALNGQSGGLRIALKSDATGDHASVMQGAVRLEATIDADESAQMLRLIGLDRAAAVAKGSSRVTINAQGPLDGPIRLDSRVAAAEGLEARMQGTLRLSNDAASGQFDLAVGNADLGWLRTAPGERITTAFTSRVAMNGRQFQFENAMASVAGVPLRGKLDVDLTSIPRITGHIDADTVDAAAIVGSIAGLPARADSANWPAEPFTTGFFGGLTGRVAVSAAQAGIGQYLVKELRTSLRLEPSEFFVETIEGEVADGKLSGDISLRKAAEGLNLKARLALQNVDARAFLSLDGGPIGGRLGLQFDVEGVGLSPKAMVGSLTGNGTLSLDRASVAGLDPRVFPTVMRAADRGLPLEPAKIRDAVAPWLDTGPLEIAHADGVLAITGGQVRLPTMIARAKGADISASGNFDLINTTLDARVALSGPAVPPAGRPEIVVSLRGPFAAPKRNIDVAALAGWLALRAVDQQSKKLEAIEQGRGAPRETAPSIPDTDVIPDAPPPDRNIALPRPRVKLPDPPQKPAAVLERAAPLPPPIEIAPAPGFRRPVSPLPGEPRTQLLTP
ncbi:MAG TPA: AsmA-like C-terminal region-containing protein, partial [Pseudorhodoplanes sp.]|nr:AsmA-like C-terminal region-containing protein [Pseudorhodoplanes sp.]